MQVARAVEQMLGDEEGQAEQMVAVLDARQATTLQVTRKVNLIKQLALDLNQVCPASQTGMSACARRQALAQHPAPIARPLEPHAGRNKHYRTTINAF